MSSQWCNYCKMYSKQHGISYKEALVQAKEPYQRFKQQQQTPQEVKSKLPKKEAKANTKAIQRYMEEGQYLPLHSVPLHSVPLHSVPQQGVPMQDISPVMQFQSVKPKRKTVKIMQPPLDEFSEEEVSLKVPVKKKRSTTKSQKNTNISTSFKDLTHFGI